MDKNKTIEILEALAAGYSPLSGEALKGETVLNDRDVIRALQFTLDLLKGEEVILSSEVRISETDIEKAIALFKEAGKAPTAISLSRFFIGTRKFKSDPIIENELYGKFKNAYSEGQLLDYFVEYFVQSNTTSKKKSGEKPYRQIDFFEKEPYNHLTPSAIIQLKDKISRLGILKTENLSEHIVTIRKLHPRAFESWSSDEVELLNKALKFTNDLGFLSDCFQRTKGSIEATGQRLIYESTVHQVDNNEPTSD